MHSLEQSVSLPKHSVKLPALLLNEWSLRGRLCCPSTAGGEMGTLVTSTGQARGRRECQRLTAPLFKKAKEVLKTNCGFRLPTGFDSRLVAGGRAGNYC